MTLKFPIFIICRDRVSDLKILLERLETVDNIDQIHLIDNNSTYPPMVEFLNETEHNVIRLEKNYGHRVIWEQHIHEEVRKAGPYIVTDPDVVPCETVPNNFLEHFFEILIRFPEVSKVGFGLRIDDLPEHYREKHDVLAWESHFWKHEIESGIFKADIDTTFAMYRASRDGPYTEQYINCFRTGSPYLARHLPWYVNSNVYSEELDYYIQRSNSRTTWNGKRHGLPGALFNLALIKRKIQIKLKQII